MIKLVNCERGIWEKKLPRGSLVERDPTIVQLCGGKRILHLGAADAPFHESAASTGKLLHQQLRRVASSLVGIDVDAGAVSLLKRQYAIDDIVCCDATNPPEDPRLKGPFDVVLCCDIIEHVDDPGGLVRTCKKYMTVDTVLVISTINATSLKSGLRALWGREAVHCDHVAYYSYGTLCSLLVRHGLNPSAVGFFKYPTVTRAAGLLFDFAGMLAPGAADGIMLTATL